MKFQEISSVLNLPIEEFVTIGERQILDPRSKIFQSFRMQVTSKLAAAKCLRDKENKKKGGRHRVYIAHAITSDERYRLVSSFPNYDIRFASSTIRSAGYTLALLDCVSEYLYQKMTPKGQILAYGVDLRSIVMRSRKWVHLCVIGSDAAVQYELLQQDRSCAVMVNASLNRGRDPGYPREYISGEATCFCTNARTCEYKGSAAIAMYHKTDTNFRQIAMYMRRHGVRLLYFAIPYSKNMELGVDGPVEGLDAYASYDEVHGKLHLVHRGDTRLTHTYTYDNYLELVARTQYIHKKNVYTKEIDTVFGGIAVYKVTASAIGMIPAPKQPPVYRSWESPDYRDMYMVHAPVLLNGGSSYNPTHYKLDAFPVKKSLVDDVVNAGLRAEGERDLAGVISRRLNAATSNVASIHQIVNCSDALAVSQFEMLAFVIYCHVFQTRFQSTQAVKALAPDAREVAENSKAGLLRMIVPYFRSVLQDNTKGLSYLGAAMRRFYYSDAAAGEAIMPKFFSMPGFVEYSQESSSNPRFRGWSRHGDPTTGFNPGLPGGEFTGVRPFEVFGLPLRESDSEMEFDVDPLALATGDAYVDEDGTFKYSEGLEVTDYFDLLVDGVSTLFTGRFSRVTKSGGEPWSAPEVYSGVGQSQSAVVPKLREFDLPQKVKRQVHGEKVDALVNRIVTDNYALSRDPHSEYITTKVFDKGELPSFVPGRVSDIAKLDLRQGLEKIFPGTTLINTTFFESDKHYSDFDVSLSGNKIKIDLSKIRPLRPERFFTPIVRGHVTPNLQPTLSTSIQAFEKRMYNTPDSTIPMDDTAMLQSAFDAYVKVFLKPGSAEMLKQFNYIGPSEEEVRHWLSKLDEAKVKKLDGQVGYDLNKLDLSRNSLHIKAQTKPNMGSSYATSVKAGQSIQYDPTNKTTAVFSPIFSQKTDREQHLLKHNVLILQRKSLDDINRFLNQFDCRPSDEGERYYIEMDYEQYDKSQGLSANSLHWKKCEEFAILPKYVEFLRVNNTLRSVSDLRAGVKAFLDVQRGSGHPDTLDGNNDVNSMALAELLVEHVDKVEFIIMQGDDVIIAMRGRRIDVSGWEREVARKFNLSMKVSMHTHGYICSNDIVHYEDGHTLIVSDVIKRSLSFMSMSRKSEELFEELYTSYADAMKNIDDLNVQNYLQHAVATRLKPVLPGITPEAVLLLCKANAKLKNDFSQFRAMFSAELTTRHY